MKNYKDIEKAAEQALSSLDNLQQLDANEYLHSKIMLRINEQHRNTVPEFYSRLLLRLALILLVLAGINGISYYKLKQAGVKTTVKTSSGAQAFANAYNLDTNSDSY